MDTLISFTPSQLIGLILSICGGVVAINAAVVVVINWIRAARKPEQDQTDRITALEQWREKVDRRLIAGDDRFSDVDEGMRVTQKALLAILGHDISGNNEVELKDAQQTLNDYLLHKGT